MKWGTGMSSQKQCFLISPIGKSGTDTRALSDNVRAFLDYEVLHGLGYKCVRGDEINKAGNITSDVIRWIINSDLVIAFLNDGNANVYYELALRHATSKICFSIISNDQEIPFDVNQEKVFKFPLDDMKHYVYRGTVPLSSPDLAIFKNELTEAIREYNSKQYNIYNPITVAMQTVLLPQNMTIDTMIEHVDKKFDLLSSDLENRFSNLYRVLKDWMPEDLKSAVRDMYQNGSATYISGEDEAFLKLTEMTKLAKKSLRTSRFAPQAISTSHNDFFHAVCAFGKRTGVECKRIMRVNDVEKEADIVKTVFDTCGGSMQLYLTDLDNNFELVVIDSTYAFLHFYDETRRIKSTLYIRGENVVKEFENIYDRFLEPSKDHKIVKIDCSKYSSPVEIMSDVTNILADFKN